MPENEKVVETKNCVNCGAQFEITDKDKEFYEKVSPVFNGEKYQIPFPTYCPDCRSQRRLAFRNERNLYKRKCDSTGKSIVSIYSPDKPYKVYSQEEWWSDKWEPMDYGKDFDFSKPFFEQFKELFDAVPKFNLLNLQSENSEFTNHAFNNKNCYLLSSSIGSEDCLYGWGIIYGNNCVDCFYCKECSYCYECIKCGNSYKLFYSLQSKNCENSYFLINCNNCTNCFLCSNLHNKKYCFRNQQYSKEEYFEKINQVLNNENAFGKLKEEYNSLLQKTVFKANNIVCCQNCEGDEIYNSQNCKECFEVNNMENCKFVLYEIDLADSMDIYGAHGSNLCVEGMSVPNSYKVGFSIFGGWNENLYYCIMCYNCEHCFGCVGLQYKKYCIFNKQYSKEEYEKLVSQIIEHMQQAGEWGEFFPVSIGPLGYNETIAQEFFPLTKEQAIEKGYKWMEESYEINIPQGMENVQAEDLPENIEDVDDSILNKAVICKVTGRPFRIIKPELEFYRRHNLPLPRRHPDQRHLERISQLNPKKLFNRKCDNCSKDMKTTYSPDRPEIVYCEECYNQYVYG